jgi:hypothetical protein
MDPCSAPEPVPDRPAADRGSAGMRRRRAASDADADAGADTVRARPLPVLHRDRWLAVVDKPAGLMVHDSALARGEIEFAADRLRAQFGRPVFLVHRLDRATSGCLLLAFDRDTASALGLALMSGAVEKDYLAVCRGWPEPEFVVDHPLDGGPGKPVKKPAVTRFERIAGCELELPSAGFPTSRYALLRAVPETGTSSTSRTPWSATPATATAATTAISGGSASGACCCTRGGWRSRTRPAAPGSRPRRRRTRNSPAPWPCSTTRFCRSCVSCDPRTRHAQSRLEPLLQ